jgi:hypothetical protein
VLIDADLGFGRLVIVKARSKAHVAASLTGLCGD